MEKLQINKFLVVEKAEIDIKRINLIIGPQANGKSLIAKVLFFFRNFGQEFIEGVRKGENKRDFDKRILEKFEERFPRYSWEGTSFIINYFIADISIKIEGKKLSGQSKTSLKIEYSDKLSRIFSARKKAFTKKVEELKRENDANAKAAKRKIYHETDVLYDAVIAPLRESDLSDFFLDCFFIPASRSFFANLQKNIFTFLAKNLDIDPYLKDFGESYETAKRLYKSDYAYRGDRGPLAKNLQMLIEQIIAGDYELVDEQDWIWGRNGVRTNLANASSGQQESLPMLLTLFSLPMMRFGDEEPMCFIEEPEAHLFPTSQGHIVSILSLLYGKAQSSFFITTHSPYIVSALNNYILASDKIREDAINLVDFNSINGAGIPIRYEDVSAYSIKDGCIESICDDEYRLIGAHMLDEIAEHYEVVMNKLLAAEVAK